ncbi:hypothetical protein E4U53_000045 [Claviceps sorghi]|nr:hypothetical protein E4U53_000045 [Claviceps sorghi]
MTTLLTTVLTALALAASSQAHMEMSNPPPLLSKFNKYTTSSDYDMTSPLHADGSNFPCKNHQRVLGTPQGQPVAQWIPGKSYSMTITGGAAHDGGSCQASLSFDKGASWKVIHSYIGNCPIQGESSYGFTLPGDTPSGTALFAWTWFNKIGNREMYMNCAVIDIVGSGKKQKKKRGTAASLAARPAMFVANVGNGCGTVEGRDVMFPNPGPDVDLQSKNTAPPTGQCGAYSSPPPSPPPPPPPPTPPSSSSGGPSSSGSGAKPAPVKPSAQTPRPPPPSSPVRGPVTGLARKGDSRSPTASPPPASSGSCKAGSFQCTTSPSGDGWQVCNASMTWVVAGTCGPDQACKFNAANGSPYCVPPGFQFP